ncbi:MAG: portal protein [Bacillota bacterium]
MARKPKDPQAALGNGVMTEQTEEQFVGRIGPIGEQQVKKAEETLMKYKDGKTALDKRIVENERWFKLQHWEMLRKANPNPGDPEPSSAWLLNAILNKHADVMDNFPEPAVLPREEGDKTDAELLTSILPVVLEQNEYEQTYSDVWWYKLKSGTGVTGVFWNKNKLNGLGDIDIRKIDILNLFWEPGITNIQRSRNLFHVDLIDRDLIEQQYPFLKDKLTSPTIETTKYIHDDTIDTSDKTAVVDWYYKVNREGKGILHFCKFCNGQVLYASENDPMYAERGFYDHGRYPFDFDTLFPEEASPAGFGMIDIGKSPQIYVDKLDQQILKTAVKAARRRPILRGDGNINEKEFTDLTADVIHVNGGDLTRDIMYEPQPELPPIVENIRLNKVEELKETTGNRDFSQGGTSSNVTAASAIAALQEAGSKLSRDMIGSSYRSHARICYFCIELMRQFYREDRYFRVTGKMGEMTFQAFNGQQIAAKPQGSDFGLDMGYRVPVFDIKVKSQKSSPFSTVAQNERAKEMFGMGFFNPEMADQALACLEIMQFENIETVRQRIAQNGTLFQKLQQLTPLVLALAQQLDALQGTQYTPQIAQILGMQAQTVAPAAQGGAEAQVNPLGEMMNTVRNSTAGAARARAARYSTPE